MTRAIGLHVAREQGALIGHSSLDADPDLREFLSAYR